jgi:hypothetical protein
MIGVFTRHPRPLAVVFGLLAIIGVIVALTR